MKEKPIPNIENDVEDSEIHQQDPNAGDNEIHDCQEIIIQPAPQNDELPVEDEHLLNNIEIRQEMDPIDVAVDAADSRLILQDCNADSSHM